MKLISMTDFVLQQEKSLENILHETSPMIKLAICFDKIVKYANFLKQPLKLEMFFGENAIFIFQWEFKEWTESDMENSTIEDLISDNFDRYILNEKAIKQLGL